MMLALPTYVGTAIVRALRAKPALTVLGTVIVHRWSAFVVAPGTPKILLFVSNGGKIAPVTKASNIASVLFVDARLLRLEHPLNPPPLLLQNLLLRVSLIVLGKSAGMMAVTEAVEVVDIARLALATNVLMPTVTIPTTVVKAAGSVIITVVVLSGCVLKTEPTNVKRQMIAVIVAG